MKHRGVRLLTYGALVALYLLHNDLWLWHDSRLVAGLPIGLVYHLAFCFAAAAVLGVLVVRVWPPFGDAPDAPDADKPPPIPPPSGKESLG